MKRKELLDSFISYCETHPEERFWQALRNWSEVNFLFVSREAKPDIPDLIDTFHCEKQNPLNRSRFSE